MKILLVGSDFEYGIEQYYKKHLAEFGCEIIHYPAPDIVFNQLSKSLINKILFKSGLLTGYSKINRELIRLAEHHKPDVIWIFKGMEIYPFTLKRLINNFKLVNYNPDHPYIISGSGSGNKNVTRSVGLYDLHFCYNSSLQEKIEAIYKIKTVFLPFGYELSEEDHLMAKEEPEINRVCFIGNPDKLRIRIITHFAKNGFEADVYGHGWDKTDLDKFSNIRIYDAVYGREFWKKLRQYRIQLNIFRKHNSGSHNMRSFEIPSVGGLQLAPFSRELAGFFAEGGEIFFYRNDLDLLGKTKMLLLSSREEISRYRVAARERSLSSHYSYRDRALTVYENFKKLVE